MGLMDILKTLLMEVRDIDVKKLPSQGIFYKDDFTIKIKKADIEDIIEYELRFSKDNLVASIECIKKVVNKNTILGTGYVVDYIKSVDIIFIFLEIVKFTTNKEIKIPFINKLGEEDEISFGTDHFNYFNFDKYMKFYDSDTKEIVMDNYRFSLPSIGIESSLTNFLSTKSEKKDIDMLNSISYNFMFFLGGKYRLDFEEIDNLIQIFNYDLDNSELEKIRKIVHLFSDVVGYSLVMDGNTIEVKTKLNLIDIWKI